MLLQARGSQTVMIEASALQEAKVKLQESIFDNPQPPADSATADNKLPHLMINQRVEQSLRVGSNSMGRSSECDIVLSDGHISRKHCVILVHSNGHCELHDMASKNGTFLNKVRISSPTRLRHGDEVQIGDIHIVVMEEGAAAGTPPAAKDAGHTSIMQQRPAC
jgi:predicted component of type VI protein secretion system